MAELARELGVGLNYTPYTWLRTDEKGLVIPESELDDFKRVIKELYEFKKKHKTIKTAINLLYDMHRFFKEKKLENCKTGYRSCVINPDATFSPCGLIVSQYKTYKELVNKFAKGNKCSSCNTTLRAATESPFVNIVKGVIRG
jgi:MoaA/NifB/PqqE/SkfB family radical SAM enzyme